MTDPAKVEMIDHLTAPYARIEHLHMHHLRKLAGEAITAARAEWERELRERVAAAVDALAGEGRLIYVGVDSKEEATDIIMAALSAKERK